MPSKESVNCDGSDGPLSAPECARAGIGSHTSVPLAFSEQSQQQTLFESLFDDAPCAYFVLDMHGSIQRANAAFLRLIAAEVQEVGLQFRSLLTSAGAIFYDSQVLPAILLNGQRGEVALDLRVGTERVPVFANFSLQKNAGVPVSIRVALFDARERRLFEKELLRSRKEAEQLAEVILHSSDAIITVQVDGNVRNWNRGAADMFGFSSHEAVGKQLSELIPFETAAETFATAMNTLSNGREYSCETVSRHRNASTIEISIKLTPHLEAPGTLVAFSAIVRDITKQKIAERALLQSEKLASVGRLASSISHEINNPLAAVTNLLYLIQLQADTPEMKQLAETAQDELSRVSQITTHTLRFHRQSTKPVDVDLNGLFESVLILFRARLRNSSIETHLEKCDVTLLCHEGELRQILLNIIGNSIDAMKFGGELYIRCRKARDLQDGTKGVRISIADTGTGMDAATLKKSSEPFFTTKGIGGTGLGLWVTQDLLRKNGGVMRVRSSTGDRHGTVSSLFLRHST